MDIKNLNKELTEILENEIEWVLEPICEIEPVSIDELEKKDILTWEGQVDIDKAVDTLHNYYKQGKLRVGIPTNTAFTYKGQTYHLSLVIGNAVQQGNKLYCKFAYKHVFDKHGKETKIINGGSLASEEDLKNAIKDIENAIDKGHPYISNNNPARLAILYNGFLYIINFAITANEITYLHTLFPPTQKYLNNNFPYLYTKTKRPKVIKQKTT